MSNSYAIDEEVTGSKCAQVVEVEKVASEDDQNEQKGEQREEVVGSGSNGLTEEQEQVDSHAWVSRLYRCRA